MSQRLARHSVSGHVAQRLRHLRCTPSSQLQRDRCRALHTDNAPTGAGQISDSDSLLAHLEARGLINQIAGDRNKLDELLRTKRMGFYCGVDPTAPSLHIGHLLPFMLSFWMFKYGHHVVSLVGGATVYVGDPTGRLSTRSELSRDERRTNIDSIEKQLGDLWMRVEGEKASTRKRGRREILNNKSWLKDLKLMHFLREMGSGVRLGAMLGRDTVKNKLEKGDGMSFAELAYPLLQAWDWRHMYEKNGVQVQIGGGDQYGNIIAGIDAIKHMISRFQDNQRAAYTSPDGKLLENRIPMGITVPLLTTASGEKFGKSAGNAVWLDPNMTSPFDLYGFLLRTADADVERYLKLFTFLELDEISEHMTQHLADPRPRRAQHILAMKVLTLVHGETKAKATRQQHDQLRNPKVSLLSSVQSETTSGAPVLSDSDKEAEQSAQPIVLPERLVNGTTFERVILSAGLVASRGAARRVVQSGGAYVGVPKWKPGEAGATSSAAAHEGDDSDLRFVTILPMMPPASDYVREGGLLLLRMGKWRVRIIKVVGDAEYSKLEQQGKVKVLDGE